MSLPDRVKSVVAASSRIPWLDAVTEEAVWDWLALELGPGWSPENSVSYGSSQLRSTPCSPIYHIVSGNTPHAAIQTLTRGILVGAINRLKTPSSELPELEDFIEGLAEVDRPERSEELVLEWFSESAAIVVFGADDTIREFSRRVEPWQRFLPHGQKISLALLSADYDRIIARQIAQDICAFDQLGCLSPQFCFVRCQPRRFCEMLAQELDGLATGSIDFSTATALRSFRDEWRFAAAQDASAGLWASQDSLRWTILLDPAQSVPNNPLYRTMIVKPWNAIGALEPLRRFVSTISVFPFTAQNVELAVGLGAQRICLPGAMQKPPLTWHHDGWPALGSLLCYVDIEESGGSGGSGFSGGM